MEAVLQSNQIAGIKKSTGMQHHMDKPMLCAYQREKIETRNGHMAMGGEKEIKRIRGSPYQCLHYGGWLWGMGKGMLQLQGTSEEVPKVTSAGRGGFYPAMWPGNSFGSQKTHPPCPLFNSGLGEELTPG